MGREPERVPNLVASPPPSRRPSLWRRVRQPGASGSSQPTGTAWMPRLSDRGLLRPSPVSSVSRKLPLLPTVRVDSPGPQAHSPSSAFSIRVRVCPPGRLMGSSTWATKRPPDLSFPAAGRSGVVPTPTRRAGIAADWTTDRASANSASSAWRARSLKTPLSRSFAIFVVYEVAISPAQVLVSSVPALVSALALAPRVPTAPALAHGRRSPSLVRAVR
jgi:hypothetical protein